MVVNMVWDARKGTGVFLAFRSSDREAVPDGRPGLDGIIGYFPGVVSCGLVACSLILYRRSGLETRAWGWCIDFIRQSLILFCALQLSYAVSCYILALVGVRTDLKPPRR